MSVKIRLARKGRRKQAYYHVVVADSRAPRDGRFIEKIGIYNPLTDPATIEIDFEKALDWIQKGAQPTETCRAILKYKGVMIKKHLLEGVRKGAFDEAEAERRFNEWMMAKEDKIETKKSGIEKMGEETRKKRLEAETAIKEARAAEYAKKVAALAAEAEAAAKAAAGEAEAPVEEVTDAPVEAATEEPEATAEAAVSGEADEETAEEATEAPVEETAAEEPAVEEKPGEEAAEEPAAEEKPAEEAAEEPVAEEKPAEEAAEEPAETTAEPAAEAEEEKAAEESSKDTEEKEKAE
jgi:small subunit ribosomal protein S16